MVTVKAYLNSEPKDKFQWEGYSFYVLLDNTDYNSWRVGDILFTGNDPINNLQIFNLRTQGWMKNISRKNVRQLEKDESFMVTI